MGLTKEGKVQSRGLEKLGRQGAICRFQKELSWRLGTIHIFLGIKLFCLSRYKAEIFSICLI